MLQYFLSDQLQTECPFSHQSLVSKLSTYAGSAQTPLLEYCFSALTPTLRTPTPRFSWRDSKDFAVRYYLSPAVWVMLQNIRKQLFLFIFQPANLKTAPPNQTAKPHHESTPRNYFTKLHHNEQ